jgi:hypothetical protein
MMMLQVVFIKETWVNKLNFFIMVSSCIIENFYYGGNYQQAEYSSSGVMPTRFLHCSSGSASSDIFQMKKSIYLVQMHAMFTKRK